MTRTEAYAKLWRLLQEHPGSVYAVAVRGEDFEVDTVYELRRLIRSRLFAGAKIVSEHTRRD